MRCLNWTDFKNTCITIKNLNLQYEDLGVQYHILGPDANGITWEITLDKLLADGTPNPDATDFVTNVKHACNFAIGTRAYSFSSSDFLFNAQGITAVVPHGTTTNLDFLIPGNLGTFMYLNGAYALTQNATFGDYVNVYAIDKNNVLGYGANFHLNSYIINWYIDPNNPLDIATPYAAKPPAGIYLRVAYTSIGIVDVSVAVNYRLHMPI